MGKKYRSNNKRRGKVSQSDWQQLAENTLLRTAYTDFAHAVQRAQDNAAQKSLQVGLPAEGLVDLREAGKILDQHPQLVSYLYGMQERREALQSARELPLDVIKASPTGTTPQSANIGGWASYVDKNQPQGVPNSRVLRDWADTNEWAMAAIDYYCNRVSRADVAIMVFDEKKPYSRAIEKTLQAVLEHPNPLGDTWPKLMRMGIRDYFTLGRMMLSKNMNARRQALELYAEDAALIKIFPAWDGSDPNAPRYLYSDGGGRTKVPLRSDEIICMLDGTSTYKFSQSRIQTLRNTIIADLKATESAAHLVDQKPPPHIVQIPGATGPQIKTLSANYSANIAGRREIMFLGGPNAAQVHPLVFSLKDNQWMEWLEYLARKFAVVFNLSLTHFSFTGDVNRATSTTQQDISEEKGLIPFMLTIEEEMNNNYVADYAPKVKGRPDIQALNLRFMFPEISEAARMMHAQAAIDLATRSLAGLPSQTLNQVLIAQGLPPLPHGGNTFYVNTAAGPIPWLSYDDDFEDTRIGPEGMPAGSQDEAGGPTVDDTTDDPGSKDDTGDSKDTTESQGVDGNDASNENTANGNADTASTAEKGYVIKDVRRPGRAWNPTMRQARATHADASPLPEDQQARKQLMTTVKRIFSEAEKRGAKTLRGVE